MEKRILPDFKSEAEEAKWWFDNQEELDKDFAQAAAEGRLTRGTGGAISPRQIPREPRSASQPFGIFNLHHAL